MAFRGRACRADLRTALEPRAPQTHWIARAFLQRVVPYCADKYLVSGMVRYKLQALCAGAVHISSPDVEFSSWLERHEGVASCFGQKLSKVYLRYHAARLQRAFLRACLSHARRALDGKMEAAAIAGGFPIAKYLQLHGGCGWTPDDIDIFVSSASMAKRCLNRYGEQVLEPLGLRLRSIVNDGSMCMRTVGEARRQDIDTLFDDVGRLLNVGRAQGGDSDKDVVDDDVLEPLLPTVRILGQFEVDIERFLSTLPEDSTHKSSCEREHRLELEEELRRSVFHLPAQFSTPSYTVRRTWRLVPVGKHIPVLLPINLIQVNTAVADVPFSDIICRGFDLLACSLSMTVDEDLTSYIFHAHREETLRSLHLRRLLLADTSFIACSKDTVKQVRRLWKYVNRGFTW